MLEDAGSVIHPGGSSVFATTHMCLPHPAETGPTVHRVGIFLNNTKKVSFLLSVKSLQNAMPYYGIKYYSILKNFTVSN